MRSEKRARRRALVPVLGVIFGMAAGIASVSWSPAAAVRADVEPRAVFDATHLPPLLRVSPGSVELAYDVHCATSSDETGEAGCDVGGTLFVRAAGDDSFTPLALERRSHDGVRQLVATVPQPVASAAPGFEYYAALEALELKQRLVVPEGGPAAPHVSRRLEGSVEVDLGRHAFGDLRRSGVRVASASWGDGPADVGLEPGRNLTPIGASAFDVDPRGNVLVLDQVHRRVLRFTRGTAKPAAIPVSVNGTLADLVSADDGTLYVLETTAPPGNNPKVRRFDDGGRELEAIETAERAPSQIRIGVQGPVVLGGSSHHWLPIMVSGTPATPGEQATRGRAGRRFRGGVEVVVFRHENEVRVALVSGTTVIRSWRLTSDSPLAEVQLAEPVGQRLVLVVRAHDGARDEFAVLVLGRSGLVDHFAVGTADWAETAPLGRFRLVGHSLYRLGSTAAAAFVDRFDLEVR
jgi:hypothetical protein